MDKIQLAAESLYRETALADIRLAALKEVASYQAKSHTGQALLAALRFLIDNGIPLDGFRLLGINDITGDYITESMSSLGVASIWEVSFWQEDCESMQYREMYVYIRQLVDAAGDRWEAIEPEDTVMCLTAMPYKRF